MRIAIASTFPPYRGGIAQFNHRLSIALQEIGHEVHCANWKRQYPSFLFPGKSQLTLGADLTSGPAAVLDSIDPKTWRATATFLMSNSPDILLIPFWHAALTPALVGVISRMKKQRPELLVVGLMHNATSHDSKFWDITLTKRFIGHLDSTFTLSEQVAKRVSELVPDQEPSVLFHPLYDHYPDLPPQLDARTRLDLPAPNEADVLLFFGLIRAYKGLQTLINAMQHLAHRERPVHLVIAGESYDDWGPYQSLIDASGMSSRIHVHNRFILDEELSTFFSSCQAVCLPYLKASQSGVTAIALHYDKPVVASDVGGLSEYLQEPGTGIVCEPNNPKLLAEAIESQLDSLPVDPRSFHAAKNRYSWSKLADHLTSELREKTRP